MHLSLKLKAILIIIKAILISIYLTGVSVTSAIYIFHNMFTSNMKFPCFNDYRKKTLDKTRQKVKNAGYHHVLAWLFSEKTGGIAIALASSLSSSSRRNFDIL